jgi:hypothetical protein
MRIPLAGLWGGGLWTFARDGWQVAVIAPRPARREGRLMPPGAADPEAALIIHHDEPIRAPASRGAS